MKKAEHYWCTPNGRAMDQVPYANANSWLLDISHIFPHGLKFIFRKAKMWYHRRIWWCCEFRQFLRSCSAAWLNFKLNSSKQGTKESCQSWAHSHANEFRKFVTEFQLSFSCCVLCCKGCPRVKYVSCGQRSEPVFAEHPVVSRKQ